MWLVSIPALARPAPAVRTPTATAAMSAARMSGRRIERVIWVGRYITGLLGVCDSDSLIDPQPAHPLHRPCDPKPPPAVYGQAVPSFRLVHVSGDDLGVKSFAVPDLKPGDTIRRRQPPRRRRRMARRGQRDRGHADRRRRGV